MDFNVVRRHLEVLSILVANLPAGEGVAVLGRNGSDCNVGIEVVDISVDYLSANLVGYVVLIDSERTVKENVLCRHGELAISNLDNVCNVSCRSPTGEGVAGLGRSSLYGYISADSVLLSFAVLYVVNKVAYGELVRNPLCVQMQVGHQKLVRTDCLFCAIGAVCIGVPAAESVAVRNGKHILENDMGIAGGSFYNGGRFSRARNSAVVRVIGYLDRNTGNVAVNVVAIGLALILDGVPYDFDVVYVEFVAQYRERVRGIGTLLVVAFAIFRPVVLGKETEFCRRNQIVNAIAIGVEYAVFFVVRVVSAVCCLFAGFGNKTRVTGIVALVLYTAVRPAARQVEFFALIIVVLRGCRDSAEVRNT